MSSGPDRGVYTRAARHGVRTRLAAELSRRARRSRYEKFMQLTDAKPGMKIVDIGCGSAGLYEWNPALAPIGVDIEDRPEYPGELVIASAAHGLPFADNEFDIAYCNSVIEHVPPGEWEPFARELRRVSKGWFVQTPAYSFPIEPHALLPAAHWLPADIKRRYWKRFAVGSAEEQIQLLRKRDMTKLFGTPVSERFGPITKSWISVHRPTD